jgi:lipopolysaccharide transport system ATP-binding protein
MARIKADNMCVEFAIYASSGRSVKNTVLNAATGGLIARDASDNMVVRALDSISFEFHDGARVGLVGHNGSGKTTLLRVLAGAYEPMRGTVEVEGRVASMLNIWLGMDLEATGYENIFMRGVIMGVRPKEIARLVDEICEFSELGDYIHMPMRTYSSGMAVRLAFAISTCVDADILLMDEWLSAGDAEFNEKAQRRLRAVVDRAKILVLVSHDPALIRGNCNQIMTLAHGKLVSLESVETAPAALCEPAA